MAAPKKYVHWLFVITMLMCLATTSHASSSAAAAFVLPSSKKRINSSWTSAAAPLPSFSLHHFHGNLLTAIANPRRSSNNNRFRRLFVLKSSTIDNTSIPPSTTASDTNDDMLSPSSLIDNPIKSAGLSFISASSKSLGMLFYNIGGLDHKDIQAHLLQAGTHLVHAGEYWSSDWSVVQESMLLASQSFYDISNVFGSANIDESLPLGTLFENISHELKDISNISGCCSVGPPCSVPNLLAIQEHLIGVSIILKKNSVASTDEHMMVTLFREVAELFGKMAGMYVDENGDGQNSEVTV